MLVSLEGKNIMITGASAGIGRATAIECNRSGAAVHLVGRNEEELRRTFAELQGEGSSYHVFDLHDMERYPELVSEIVDKGGKLDGFVHAAGIQYMLPLASTLPEHYSDTLEINTISAFELARIATQKKNIALSGMQIVFVASVMSVVGDGCMTSYAASKTALVGGARCLAVELASRGIRVNCVSPGSLEDTRLANLRSMLSEDDLLAYWQKYPLSTGGTGDVASLCVYLLSEHAKWITGQNFVIDGGYSAK